MACAAAASSSCHDFLLLLGCRPLHCAAFTASLPSEVKRAWLRLWYDCEHVIIDAVSRRGDVKRLRDQCQHVTSHTSGLPSDTLSSLSNAIRTSTDANALLEALLSVQMTCEEHLVNAIERTRSSQRNGEVILPSEVESMMFISSPVDANASSSSSSTSSTLTPRALSSTTRTHNLALHSGSIESMITHIVAQADVDSDCSLLRRLIIVHRNLTETSHFIIHIHQWMSESGSPGPHQRAVLSLCREWARLGFRDDFVLQPTALDAIHSLLGTLPQSPLRDEVRDDMRKREAKGEKRIGVRYIRAIGRTSDSDLPILATQLRDDFDAKQVAKHLTFVAASVVHAVPLTCWRRTFKALSAAGKAPKDLTDAASALQALSKWWEDTALWIVLTILYPPNPPKDKTLLEASSDMLAFWLSVCAELKELRNFHSLMNVHTALSHDSLYRLKPMWKQLPRAARQQWRELTALFSPSANYAPYRTEVATRAHTLACLANASSSTASDSSSSSSTHSNAPSSASSASAAASNASNGSGSAPTSPSNGSAAHSGMDSATSSTSGGDASEGAEARANGFLVAVPIVLKDITLADEGMPSYSDKETSCISWRKYDRIGAMIDEVLLGCSALVKTLSSRNVTQSLITSLVGNDSTAFHAMSEVKREELLYKRSLVVEGQPDDSSDVPETVTLPIKQAEAKVTMNPLLKALKSSPKSASILPKQFSQSPTFSQAKYRRTSVAADLVASTAFPSLNASTPLLRPRKPSTETDHGESAKSKKSSMDSVGSTTESQETTPPPSQKRKPKKHSRSATPARAVTMPSIVRDRQAVEALARKPSFITVDDNSTESDEVEDVELRCFVDGKLKKTIRVKGDIAWRQARYVLECEIDEVERVMWQKEVPSTKKQSGDNSEAHEEGDSGDDGNDDDKGSKGKGSVVISPKSETSNDDTTDHKDEAQAATGHVEVSNASAWSKCISSDQGGHRILHVFIAPLVDSTEATSATTAAGESDATDDVSPSPSPSHSQLLKTSTSQIQMNKSNRIVIRCRIRMVHAGGKGRSRANAAATISASMVPFDRFEMLTLPHPARWKALMQCLKANLSAKVLCVQWCDSAAKQRKKKKKSTSAPTVSVDDDDAAESSEACPVNLQVVDGSTDWKHVLKCCPDNVVPLYVTLPQPDGHTPTSPSGKTDEQASFSNLVTSHSMATSAGAPVDDTSCPQTATTLDRAVENVADVVRNVKQRRRELRSKHRSRTHRAPEGMVKLNFGGERVTTKVSTLLSRPSVLRTMFNGSCKLRKDDQNYYFIDRDGTVIRHLINFLRNPAKFPRSLEPDEVAMLMEDAQFYELEELISALGGQEDGKSLQAPSASPASAPSSSPAFCCDELRDLNDALAAEMKVLETEDAQVRHVEKVKQIHSRHVVRLNVGGTVLCTTLATLRSKEGLLKELFSNGHMMEPEEDGSFFIDRDGTCVWLVLRYLRGQPLHLRSLSDTDMDQLANDAEHYRLSGLKALTQPTCSSASSSLETITFSASDSSSPSPPITHSPSPLPCHSYPSTSTFRDLLTSEQLELLRGWCGGPEVQFELLWHSSVHGNTARAFHARCDNVAPTLTLIRESDHGWLFGGYTDAEWDSDGAFIESKDSFLFTLTNPYNKSPHRFPITTPQYAINGDPLYGPYFGLEQGICVYPSGRSSTIVGGWGRQKTLTGSKHFEYSDVLVFRVTVPEQ